MSQALQVFLRPLGPWRMGSANGSREETSRIFHSDTLYGAVCSAMGSLGWLEEWLAATATAEDEPPVRLSSLFPAVNGEALAPAPANLWPPAGAAKLRCSGAKMIPAQLVGSLASGQGLNEEIWEVDGQSECLLRRGGRAGRSPFRTTVRSLGAVDRWGGAVTVHRAGCVEFGENCGLWGVVEFAGGEPGLWRRRIEACLRLLADTGMGGERSKGWGAFAIDRVAEGETRTLLFGQKSAVGGEEAGEQGYWLLSLYSPGPGDAVDWTRGSYLVMERGGRVETAAAWGAEKKRQRMIAEGSVLAAAARPRGAASDVAPEGSAHPVYRAGFAVSVEIPLRVNV
jgi:CRISPR type III-A-associated RAMP protein Csm4